MVGITRSKVIWYLSCSHTGVVGANNIVWVCKTFDTLSWWYLLNTFMKHVTRSWCSGHLHVKSNLLLMLLVGGWVAPNFPSLPGDSPVVLTWGEKTCATATAQKVGKPVDMWGVWSGYGILASKMTPFLRDPSTGNSLGPCPGWASICVKMNRWKSFLPSKAWNLKEQIHEYEPTTIWLPRSVSGSWRSHWAQQPLEIALARELRLRMCILVSPVIPILCQLVLNYFSFAVWKFMLAGRISFSCGQNSFFGWVARCLPIHCLPHPHDLL